MHQFVEVGIALYNPDDPARPVNSPTTCDQVGEEALRVMRLSAPPGGKTRLKTGSRYELRSRRSGREIE